MIDIKDIQGNVMLSVPVTQSCQKVEELMGTDHIQLSWNSEKIETLPLGSFIEHEGERYSLLEPYFPSQKNEMEYTYTPQFKSRVMAWGKMPFFFYSGESKEPDWTLTSNPADFMRCICDAILNETGESWSYSIDASLPASASLSFTSVDILSGLNQIAGAFETEWFADKKTNTLYLGLLSHGEAVTLEVGKNINVPSVQGNREGYYTRFYAFGSTRNITQDYEGSNTNNLVNKRLTLDPAKYPNGYKDIREGLSEGEIFSKVLIFDEVYPSAKLSISGVRNRLMYRLDTNGDRVQVGTDDEGNPIYDQYAIWYFRIEGFDFDVSNIIEGYKLSVSFQSGALQGREFELKYYEKDTEISTSDGLKFEAKAGDYEILFVEEGSLILPSMTGLVPGDGDSVILFNIKMPSEYTQSAYSELEERLDKEITRMTSDLNNYSFKSNPIAFNENNPNLSVGQKVTYINGSYSYTTRVMKLTTQLDFPIEQEITIGNQKVKGNTQQLKEEVASANKDLNLLAVFNDMTQSIQQSYNRTQQMMLEGFAAIKNIWQLRETASGEKYAWSAFNVVTQQGMTMYKDGTNLDLPSIYKGLPIDNQSIYWEDVKDEEGNVIDKVLKAKVSTEEGGSATLLGELTNVGAWANAIAEEDRLMVQKKGSSSWTSLSLEELGTASFENVKDSGEGNAYTAIELSEDKKTLTLLKGETFATKKEHDELGAKVKDFLEGSDTDGIINKWKELESFLSNMEQSDNLAEILSGKADKDAVEEEFKKYVTLAEDEEITGAKNFTGGLSVNSAPIVYRDGHWLFTGDMLVTGALTMYANEGTYTPSTIMDGVQVDWKTIVKDADGNLALNPDLELGEGLDEDALRAYLVSYKYVTESSLSGYATQSWVKEQKYLTEHQDLSGYQTKITTSNKLAYSLISGTPSSLKNPYTLTFGSKTYDGSEARTITASDLGALTQHQTIYNLTLKGGKFSAITFDPNGAASTVNIPTNTSHLTNDSNFITSSYVDGKFVTIDGTEDVTGVHDFTNGLKIGGVKVSKSQDGVVLIEGDLVLKGGLTMYSDSSATSSNIMNALLLDPNTLELNSLGQLTVIGGTGGASTWDELEGKPSYLGDTGLNYALSIKNSAGAEQVSYNGGSFKSLTLTKAMVGLGNVENTALSTWAGSTKIVTLGTITTGTWHGAKIENAYLANSSITINGKSTSLGGSVDLYIGTTKAQTTAAEQNLTGIGKINNAVKIGYSSSDYGTVTFGLGSAHRTIFGGDNAYANNVFYFRPGWSTSGVANAGVYIQSASKASTGDTEGSFTNLHYFNSSGDAYHKNSLSINGIKLSKSQDGVLYLEGNLVVSGAVTMFGTNSVTASTVMDGVSVDGTTIIKSGGKLMLNPDLELGGGLDENELANYLSTNRYLTQTTGDARYITAIGISGNSLTYTKNGTTQNVTVPYATNADKLDGLDSTDFIKVNGSLTSNVNFDDYYTSGSYNNTTGNGSGNSNIPGSYGLMLVFGDKGGYAAQLHIGSSADSVKIRTRYSRSGSMSWTGWNELVVASDAHTIIPSQTNTYNLGSSSYKWSNVYATTFNGSLSGNATSATTATNLASAPSLAESGTTQITVTAGGKTSSAFTVPYATNANNSTSATTASKLSTVSKTAWGQTYWTAGGVPTNISGNMTGIGNITMSGSINSAITINSGDDSAFIKGSGHKMYFGGSGYANQSYYFRPLYGASGATNTNLYIQNASAAASPTFTTTHSFLSSGNASHTGNLTVGGGGTFGGNVGIGTSSPSYQLHVLGDIGNENIRLRYSTSNPFLSLVRSTSSETWYVQAISGYLAMGGGSSTALRVDADGNVEIAGNLLVKGGVTMYATSDTNGLSTDLTPSETATYNLGSESNRWLGIYSNTGNFSGKITMTGDTAATCCIGFNRNHSYITFNGVGASEGSINFGTGTTGASTVMRVSSLKRVGINTYQPTVALDVVGDIKTSGTLTQGSDIRYKEIHKNVTLPLAAMAEAPSFEFHFTDGETKDTHIGTSAQYWKCVDGVVSEGADGRLGMDYSSLGVVMGISLAKELSRFESETDRRIRLLEKENEELRKEIEQLKTA